MCLRMLLVSSSCFGLVRNHKASVAVIVCNKKFYCFYFEGEERLCVVPIKCKYLHFALYILMVLAVESRLFYDRDIFDIQSDMKPGM